MMKQMQTLAVHGGAPVRIKPFPKWPIYGELEEKLMLETIRSGNWGGVDPVKLAEFEQKFAALQSAKYALSINNGTIAIAISLMACGVDIGDEVIMPPYTFIATPTSALLAGAIPVFVDIDETMQLDTGKVEAAITSKTKAIVAVHIGGATPDMTRLKEIAAKHRVALIEDAAQAVGTQWEGKGVGAIGDLGTFSLQSSKNLNCGEGGVILSDNKELADKVRSLHNCGRIPDGAWYQHEIIGWNFRMSELQAALALGQMSRLEEQMNLRERNAQLLNQMVQDIPGLKVMRRDPRITRHSNHIYMLRIDPALAGTIDKEDFLKKLNAEGIPSVAGYVPLNLNQAIIDRTKKLAGKEQIYDCPVAEKTSKEQTFWMGQNMLLGTEEDIHDVAAALKKVTESFV
jgi:dTDP-4-amino-4,6-dideoxygalactose transaminase